MTDVSRDGLADRIRACGVGRPRILVAIAGAPGSGKSTLAAELALELGHTAAAVPMDGFHLDNDELQGRGLLHRKGMPETFDVGPYHFEIVDLSGHQEDMVGFYEPEQKWFFSADGVPLPTRKYIAMPDENVPKMITTMERIQELEIEILFDGHRGPIQSPREHIQKRIDYLNDTQVKVKEMHEEGLEIQQMMEKLELSPPWYIEMTKDRFAVEFFIKSLINDSP